MNDEKKYNEALERARKLYEQGTITESLCYVFPELKESEESEDEKIRQFLIHEVKETSDEIMSYRNISKKDVLAWLEKQREQETLCDKCRKEHPSHSCQDITALGRCAVEYEQKSIEWEPQTGDTFRKKGTTSPTYHLCGKREDGITFGFVENREVGIAGGEITTFTLKRDYELVERQKPIEDVVEEELNKALQTKVEQKTAWSEEDEKLINRIEGWLDTLCDYLKDSSSECVADVKDIIGRLKSLKERCNWKPSDEQMDALHYVTNFDYGGHKATLVSLYEQLKKLK